MKHLLYILLYLNIYTTFFYKINAQELHLTVETESVKHKTLLDSLNIKTTFKNYLSLKKEIDTLQYIFERIGFAENKLISLQKRNDSTYNAKYFLGNKYKQIKIYYSEEDFNKKELTQISEKVTENYFIIPISTTEASLKKLILTKTKNGNTFARLHLENISVENNNSITATLILISSKKRTIDKIIVKGYDKFPKSYLKYYAGIKTGNTFNKQVIINQSESLNSLRFVTNQKPPEILFQKDSTIVYLYLKKQKNNLFDGILGFSTNEESKKLVLNGYLNLELNNNLNFGEQFLLNYKADGNDQQNFRVKITLPYLLKSPFGVGLELKIFKRDTTFSTTDQQARLTYQITPTSKSFIGYKSYESNDLRKVPIPENSVEDYKSKFFIVGIRYSKIQNNSLFPTKTFFLIDSEIGSRKSKNKNESQVRVSAILNHIFNLNYKNSIFLQSDTHLLTSDTFLTNELFRFGGINSIRGFNENSIDASFYSVLNTEYRYQFNKDIYLHSIIDVAYFKNNITTIEDKLYSFGIGIGLQTRAGILRLNIANGNTENQDFNFSNTKIHISITSNF